MNCINLISVKLPQKLYGIEHMTSTFENCKNLEYVDLSQFEGNEDLLDMDKMFKNCHKLKNVTFPRIEAEQLISANKQQMDWKFDWDLWDKNKEEEDDDEDEN